MIMTYIEVCSFCSLYILYITEAV